jgi:signal transduction histidine kinase
VMKFLTKLNRNYLVLFTAILLISSVAGYFILYRVILDATKESLLEKKNLIISQIRATGKVPGIYPILEVKKSGRFIGSKPGFNMIMIENESEDEAEPYLEYSEEVMIGGEWYTLKLRQSAFENEDLVLIITLSFFMIITVSLGITFFISRKMNRTIWTDFETNLEAIEQFSLDGNQKIALVQSNIEEFDRLNRVIEKQTGKLRADYLSLKEFTENASHEIQTPLSVALLHLDELLQMDLNEEAFSKTLAVIQDLKRLSSLNQSLILLAKIENRQFKAEREISISDLIKRKLKEFDTLFESKKLDVTYSDKSDFRLHIHEQLADILINNLLSNAMNHNYEGGNIRIITDRDEIRICNTGHPNTLEDNSVFNRFTKGASKSFGLGLAIVKKICDTHHLEIRYLKTDLHCFLITKNINEQSK